jgi:hypothetical protein
MGSSLDYKIATCEISLSFPSRNNCDNSSQYLIDDNKQADKYDPCKCIQYAVQQYSTEHDCRTVGVKTASPLIVPVATGSVIQKWESLEAWSIVNMFLEGHVMFTASVVRVVGRYRHNHNESNSNMAT